MPAMAMLIMMGGTGANLSKSFTTTYGKVSFSVGVGVRCRKIPVLAAVLDVTVANIRLHGMSA